MARLFMICVVLLGGWFTPSTGFSQTPPVIGPFEWATQAQTPEKAIWVMRQCAGRIPLRVGARLVNRCKVWTADAVEKLSAELLAPLTEEDTLTLCKKYDGKVSGEQVVKWSRGFARTDGTLAAWKERLEKAEDVVKLIEAWKKDQ